MKTTLSALLLCSLVAPGGETGPEASNSEGPFQRSVNKALDRAQVALVSKTELWVDHSTWENAWEVRSRHYLVRTTQSRPFAVAIGEHLEYMFSEMQKILGSDFEPASPFPIYILPDLPTYNQFGDDHGAEHSSMYGSFYASGHEASPVAAMYWPDSVYLGMWISHSACHQFLEQAFPGREFPALFTEGLASYFSLYWDYSYGVTELEKIRQANALVPLTQLAAEKLPAYTAENSHVRFIELGMLFRYLLHHKVGTRNYKDVDGNLVSPFGEYIQRMVSGGDPSNLKVNTLFTDGLADLDTDFRAYTFPVEG